MAYVRLHAEARRAVTAGEALATLPEWARPAIPIFCSFFAPSGVVHGDIGTDGTVSAAAGLASGDVVLMTACWGVA